MKSRNEAVMSEADTEHSSRLVPDNNSALMVNWSLRTQRERELCRK